jgi:3-phenylpropionate/trans-cinnamate dioxygenase ferredoxin subunit
MKTSYTWYKIAEDENEIDFQANNMAMIEVNNKKIGIGRFGNKIFAFASKCPHAGGILTEGWMDPNGNIVCPLHRYKYNIENGRNVSGEGYYLKHWPVEVRGNGVFVGMEPGGLSAWVPGFLK